MYIDSGMRIAAVYCCVVVKPRAPRLSRRDETEYNERIKREQQKSKFDFEELKAGAMSADPRTRKDVFKEYFERFEEFPSYLFDNSEKDRQSPVRHHRRPQERSRDDDRHAQGYRDAHAAPPVVLTISRN